MTGNSISKINSKGVYVKGNDIDTDRIIPARFLKCVTFDEGDAAEHAGAEILISDANFGCGSSREHAPQAIQKFGLKAVIAESFAEIFHGNCTTLGIPCVVMATQERMKLAELIAADPNAELIIDIEALKVICANNIFTITMKTSAREALLSANYDPLDTLMRTLDKVDQTAQRLGYA